MRDIRQPLGAGPGGIPSSRNTWGGASKSFSAIGVLRRVLPVLVVVALLVFAGSSIYSCVSGKLAGGGQDAQTGQPADAPAAASYEPSVEGIASVPASGETLVGFSLAEGDAGIPSMSESQLAAVNAVLAHYEPSDRAVGFMMLDLETGRGWAYNVDAEVYGASAIKEPVALFACEQADAGAFSLSSFKNHAEDAIVWSDNDSYFRLSNVVDARGYGTAFSSWLEDLGLDPTLLANGSFATFSTRDLATFWMRTYLYLDSSDSEVSNWFAGLLSGTEISMIRDGVSGTSPSDIPDLAASAAAELFAALQDGVVYSLASVEHADEAGEGAVSPAVSGASSGVVSPAASAESDGASPDASTASSSSADDPSSADSALVVYNKGGWIAGEDCNAVNDAGIIVEDGRSYLMCIMTAVPDTDANRALLSNLARALWETRATLQV